MAETIKEVKDAELVQTPPDHMLDLIKESDKSVYKALSNMSTLDWRSLSPPQMALLLMAKPYPVSGGGVTFLNFKQALLYAVRCFELQLSPFSDNVWYDVTRGSVNLTMSGKRELARMRGIDLGPPEFEETVRNWEAVPKITAVGEEARKQGFTKDMGVRCKMRVGDVKNNEHVTYCAWINDWFQPKSPVWRERPGHMLTIRSNEKALTLVLGTGASQMPDEKELE